MSTTSGASLYKTNDAAAATPHTTNASSPAVSSTANNNNNNSSGISVTASTSSDWRNRKKSNSSGHATLLDSTAAQRPQGASSSAGMMTASSSSLKLRQHPARIQFCPTQACTLYGAVNCWKQNDSPTFDVVANARANPDITTAASTDPILAPRIKKLGPVLLEIRHLRLNHSYQQRRLGMAYSGSTVAVCRGNPALGSQVASTCLSFRQAPSAELLQCATGLTTGALCIHTLRNVSSDGEHGTILDSAHSEDATVAYYAPPRHLRLATSVAWRNNSGAESGRHVAIGLMGSGGGDRGGTTHGNNQYQPRDNKRVANTVNSSAIDGGTTGGGIMTAAAVGGGSGDREFCCFVWDVEAQSGNNGAGTGTIGMGRLTIGNSKVGAPVAIKGPAMKYAHNAGVASLTWISDGQLLAIGCQYRNVQIYDLRVSGVNTPPISTYAHADAVNGIEVDPHRPNILATFSQGHAEPVKLWDVRRMESCLAEIKTSHFLTSQPAAATVSGGGIVYEPTAVTALAWSSFSPGTLCFAIGDTVRYFDTTVSGSRPVLTGMSHSSGPIQCIASQPIRSPRKPQSTVISMVTGSAEGVDSKGHSAPTSLAKALYLDRMLVVHFDGTVRDMPNHQIAPLAISSRDGRVSHAFGSTVWMGSTTQGPSAMEKGALDPLEDISATMMRRARCLDSVRYSTDANANLQLLAHEQTRSIDNDNFLFKKVVAVNDDDVADDGENDNHEQWLSNRAELWRVWSWIERVERLSAERDEMVVSAVDDTPTWPVKGLSDAGILKILRMDADSKDDFHFSDNFIVSESLYCNTYDSPLRRAAFTACGWHGKIDLKDVLADCEALGHYERSATLAIWHGHLGEAVAALQRGADDIRLKLSDGNRPKSLFTIQYAETLELVAMCIAGYSGNNRTDSVSESVWRRACEGLLRRQDFSIHCCVSRSHVPYLRAACVFLINIGQSGGLDKTLYDETLSLSDRVAFACRFLGRRELKDFLLDSFQKCLMRGSIEGILITGLEKRGIALLQSYVDTHSDVQTAALVSSRVIFPLGWVEERVACSEWLHSYREILNTWQMWQSRAMFDVGRCDLLRQLRGKQEELTASSVTVPRGSVQHQIHRGSHAPSRKQSYAPSSSAKQPEPEAPIPIFPAQLYARCNFCHASLPLSRLRRQESIEKNSSWLSHQKPVLTCCPQCRNPLPRCAICLLPLGCLNPYMELKRERSRSSRTLNTDDLSELANLPFAEWFTWCMRCKHGGHAHHLVGWFANHETCPVSACDCQCQFDGTQKLSRPALKN